MSRQGLVVLAHQPERRAEGHARWSRARQAPADAQHVLEPVDSHGHDRHAEPGGDHADAGTEGVDDTGFRPAALRKDEHRGAFSEQFPDVPQRLPGPRLPLRQRERIEKQRREVVVEAVGEPREAPVPVGKEVRREHFFCHRGRERVAPP